MCQASSTAARALSQGGLTPLGVGQLAFLAALRPSFEEKRRMACTFCGRGAVFSSRCDDAQGLVKLRGTEELK